MKTRFHSQQPRLYTVLLCCLFGLFSTLRSPAQTAAITVQIDEKHQIIDGFGAHQGNNDVNQGWWQELYYDDLRASIYRVDLTPRLAAPYSDLNVYSPWFMGSGTNSVFNLEDPDNPNGPEGNRVRTYTGPEDYSRTFGGENAPIAVMGPDIDANIDYFSYSPDGAISEGIARRAELGDFKLIGSFWSPLPWVKISSGNSWDQNWWPGPVQGSPWPFIWGGNFAGGRLDVSDTPLEVFNDGTGPTSSLTQFARSTAAYVRGYQNFHQARFYAISIQNELNFEQFYNSATYPLSSQYIAALKAVRAEFDKYDDLKDIRIMGPEDLLGGDAYGMWQYGGGSDVTHKNLQYLQALAADPEAMDAIDFFCIHGYDASGVSSSGATSGLWNWWRNGWQQSPAPGIPTNIPGYASYGKKSWMTETSGENAPWLSPATGYPSNGGWGVALRLHQALTDGEQSAWVYWTFTEADEQGNATAFALSTQSLGADSPKYVAAKHFFRYIRPGAYRVATATDGDASVLSSAYTHEADGSITIVLINTGNSVASRRVQIPGLVDSNVSFQQYTSSDDNYWQAASVNFVDGAADISLPAYSVVTLYGTDALSTGLLDRGQADAPFQLWQNVPNPCSDKALIRFEIARSGPVQISLSDLEGRVIRSLLDEQLGAGKHELVFQRKDLAPGVYQYTMRFGGFVASRKMVVLE